MQLGIKDTVSYAFYIMNLFLPNIIRSVFITIFFFDVCIVKLLNQSL